MKAADAAREPAQLGARMSVNMRNGGYVAAVSAGHGAQSSYIVLLSKFDSGLSVPSALYATTEK
jgi:hypothetical protein